MIEQSGTLELLARGLSAALVPVSNALDSPEALRAFLEELGWQAPDNLASIGIEPSRVEAVISALQDLLGLDYDTADAGTISGKYATVLATVAALVQHIYEAQTRIATILDGAYLAASNIASELPRRLLDYLIIEHLMETKPIVFQSLVLLGLVELKDFLRDDATFTSEHTRRIVHYDRLTKLVTDPTRLFRDVYGWGTAAADLKLLIERLHDLALLLGLPAALVYPVFEKEVNLSSPATVPQEGEAENPELRIPVLGTEEGAAVAAEAGITLMPIAPPPGGQFGGLALCPYATGAITASIPLGAEGRWILTLSSALNLVAGIGLVFRPGEILKVLTNILGNASSASGQLSVDLRRQQLNGERLSLIGTATGTGLTATTLYGKVSLLVGTGQETDFTVEFVTEGGRLRLDFGSGDSFLAALLPVKPVDLLFDIGVGWSNHRGLFFTGGAGLEYSTSVHETIGPIQLEIIHFGLKFKDGEVHSFMAITGGAKLGPLAASVESIGLELVLSFPSSGGNVGPANFTPKFKPPNGVGLAIDAGAVKGGGYLYFNSDKEEYAGALELAFAEFLTLKAIGLVTTRMPDGSKGFSMLVIITAEFGSPIQLSFGFTLSGVGGLLGLHRTMLLQPLADGVRTGAVNSVMFPQNVVENAPRIISDLQSFFPPFQGIFLIGPMAKIGWGTPNLVTLSLGIIIEIPGNIVILGVLKVALPDENADLLHLQVNFIGAIEFDKKQAWFFASMFDSRVLTFTIEGQMGVLVAWGDDPNFVVSVGGFHPAFKAPPLPFPEPQRIAISILNTDHARVRVDGYFAVTSNTAQFGARAEMYFGLSDFEVDGQLTFDALFQFSPFYFIITISSSLSVKVFGVGAFSVRFRGSLEGPTPWRVQGTGSISLWLFDLDVDFSKTWGQEVDTTLPPIQVAPLLAAEFGKPENWKTQLSEQTKLFVSLRKIETANSLVLHPLGTLQVSQRAIPLELQLDKVGSQKPEDANYFTVCVTSSGLAKEDDINESFAMAQFKDMDDSKKLSSPAYQKWKGGIELSATVAGTNTSLAVKRTVRYEKIIVDTNYKRFVRHLFVWSANLFSLFLNGNSVAKANISQRYQKQKQPFTDKVAIQEEGWVVASTVDNSPLHPVDGHFSCQAKASEYMHQKVAASPELAGTIHVIPEAEMRKVA
jgi:hypothetical protein